MDFGDKTIIELNVSHLPAPEPFFTIMETLSKIRNNEILKIIHRKEPFPLYEELKKMNYNYKTIKISDNHFHIFIYK